MNDGLILRRATREDDAGILQLFRDSFGHRALPPEWWEWFSYTCPTGENRTYVAEDPAAGRFAASYSVLPLKIRYNDREILGSLAVDASTHPDYRGRGLFVRMGKYTLGREVEHGSVVTLGMPNLAALPGHRKTGWEEACMLPFLVRSNPRAASNTCREVERFDARLDALLARVADRYTLMVLKDHRFLNWRVAERPDIRYTKFILEDGAKLAGYGVLKHYDAPDQRRSHILDIQADSDDALHELITAAETLADGRDELNLWTNPYDPLKGHFLARGFAERPGNDRLIIHHNFGERVPLRTDAWSFTLADNDVY